ncbi:ribonuclease H1-like [Leptopilina boulardi]|uniref:ribonuclease H1-like n=1 Tax=Leptopilina boulardi TaxID=63433 RepID=UPI0021F5DF95|nr:ribonuclease H1-like [Leptopilina boulardi]XP_051170597.1 ribonuclease H1-like [Leptopilina boulardi]
MEHARTTETASIAATKANESGHKYLKIFTDSRFLIDSMTKRLPRWKESDWRTSANKPVLNRVEFEKLEEALSPLDVVFEHVPSHQEIEGNEEADKLAVKQSKINKEYLWKQKPRIMTKIFLLKS